MVLTIKNFRNSVERTKFIIIITVNHLSLSTTCFIMRPCLICVQPYSLSQCDVRIDSCHVTGSRSTAICTTIKMITIQSQWVANRCENQGRSSNQDVTYSLRRRIIWWFVCLTAHLVRITLYELLGFQLICIVIFISSGRGCRQSWSWIRYWFLTHMNAIA